MKKNSKGYSIVSVMAAFVILLMGLGIFYTAISFSQRMTLRAVDFRQGVEDTMENYYMSQVGSGTGANTSQEQTYTIDVGDSQVEVSCDYETYTYEEDRHLYAFKEKVTDVSAP